jgi:putative oxidoreductase
VVSNREGEGYEYHLLAMAIGIALVITGGGKASIDRALTVPAAPARP